MYRFLVLLITPFLFAACSLPGTQEEGEVVMENTESYETEDITIRVPKTWSGKTT
jgi:hypothetical protein